MAAELDPHDLAADGRQLPGVPSTSTTDPIQTLGQVQIALLQSREDVTEPADLLAALASLRRLREELASWEPQLITAARRRGVSWASLASAIGVTSRQAAERRYLRLRPSETGERTGEARVNAERARRAGDRAVTAWARENAGALRQLAGQISALKGLATAAQHHVDKVRMALADNDPARLLSPLADTRSHLQVTHGAIADRIRTIAEHTERLRRRPADDRRQTG
jgi:hypothetical protein